MKRLVRWGVLASLLSMCGVAYAEMELGRLFYTPAERRALDRQEVAGTPDEATASPVMTLNGRIVRSDGKTITWTNGSLAEDGAQPLVTQNAKLKVGQSVEVMTGEAHDLLRGGSLVVHERTSK